MCGRYALYSPAEKLAKYFSATVHYHFGKSYNIAPTSTIAVLVAFDNERLIVPMRWGLIPSWHKPGQKLSVLNNAKIETIDTKPTFRAPFKRHRCLIIADGFYEWDSSTKPKQPYYFHRSDNEPITLAGIWDKWEGESETIDSCCIITEAANKVVSPVHDRMPGIILPDQYDAWLDTTINDVAAIKKMATASSAYSEIVRHPVTPKMNRVAYNQAACIKEI